MITVNDVLDVEKYLDNVKVVVFDLDDTLFYEKDYVKSGYVFLGEKYPNIKDFSNRLWNYFLQGKKAIDCVLEEENLLAEKQNCLNLYREHIPTIELSSGVREMLERIKSTKKLGMITDGRVNGQNNKIDALNIRRLFDKIIITDELGIEFRKPNERAFAIIREYFGVLYSEIVYIGDNINKDFIAPDKLGMQSIYFKNGKGIY